MNKNRLIQMKKRLIALGLVSVMVTMTGCGNNSDNNENGEPSLVENNYQVCLNEVSDYVEGHVVKEYYSLEEIKELEPLVKESLKIINLTKVKTKEYGK